MNRATPSASVETTALALGIGCRRDVSVAQIERAVQTALDGRPLADVSVVATIDLKADEPALLAFCAAHALPLRVFARAALASTAAPGPASGIVRAHVGVDGVCEPCAQLAAEGGPLVRGKLALDGVTVALAAIDHYANP